MSIRAPKSESKNFFEKNQKKVLTKGEISVILTEPLEGAPERERGESGADIEN